MLFHYCNMCHGKGIMVQLPVIICTVAKNQGLFPQQYRGLDHHSFVREHI